jgi:hypothetical protein
MQANWTVLSLTVVYMAAMGVISYYAKRLTHSDRVSCLPFASLLPTAARKSRWRPDCVAGQTGFELRNVVAKHRFERSLKFPGIGRILASETIRV